MPLLRTGEIQYGGHNVNMEAKATARTISSLFITTMHISLSRYETL